MTGWRICALAACLVPGLIPAPRGAEATGAEASLCEEKLLDPAFYAEASWSDLRACVEALGEERLRTLEDANTGDTPLHVAARASGGQWLMLQQVGRAMPGRIDELNFAKQAPLHVAAAAGRHSQMIAILVALGAEVDATGPVDACRWDQRGTCATTPLHLAARRGEAPAIAMALMDAGASIEAWDENRNRPLHHAASVGSLPMVRALLARGGSTRAINNDDKTPLHLALENDAPLDVVEALMDEGRAPLQRLVAGPAPLRQKDHAGMAPVHVAARDATDTAVVAFIVEQTRDAELCAETESGTDVLILLDGNDALPRDQTYSEIHDRCPNLSPRVAE